MKTEGKTTGFIFAVMLLMAIRTNASILSGTGPANPVDCPDGSAAVINLKSSVGWWEGPPFGGGEWHILFRGNTEAFVETLTNFAAIHAPALDLVIHNGPKNDVILEAEKRENTAVDARVDWVFIFWNPESWSKFFDNTNNVVFLKNDPRYGQPVPAPRLDVYIGGGQVNWEAVKVPANLRVRDERMPKKK